MLRSLRGLRVQLLLWAIFPLTVIVVAVSATGIYSHQMAMRNMVAERDTQLVRIAARLMDERLALYQHLLQTVAGRSDFLTTAVDVPEFDRGLFLRDPDHTDSGVTPVSPLAKHTYPGEQATDALAVPAMQMGQASISAPFLDSVIQAKTVLFGTPLPDRRILLGLASFDQLAFPEIIQNASFGVRGSACLVNDKGTVAYHPDPAQNGQDLSQVAGVLEVCQGKEGTTFQTGPDGREMVISYAPLPTSGWGLIIQESWADSVAPVMRVSQMTPLILVLTTMAALLIIFFGIRYIIRPLQMLEQEARRVAHGELDAILEPVGGVEEINSLRQTLNLMTVQIRAHQTALRDYLSALTHAEEDERRHLARELHDDTVQTMVALIQRLEVCERADGPDDLTCRLEDVRTMASRALDSLRRLIYNLRPLYLEDLGLVAAIETLGKEAERGMGAPRVQIDISGHPARLSPDLELTAFRILQEALSNLLRHAKAHTAHIRVEFGEESLTLSIRDDGQGFIAPVSPQDWAQQGHFGLLGMRERALRFGGHLSIQSEPGHGATLMVSLPYDRPTLSTRVAP